MHVLKAGLSFGCFANVDGSLVPSDDGFFGDSCENITIDKWLDGGKTALAPVFLRADCRTMSGKLVSAAIEISERFLSQGLAGRRPAG